MSETIVGRLAAAWDEAQAELKDSDKVVAAAAARRCESTAKLEAATAELIAAVRRYFPWIKSRVVIPARDHFVWIDPNTGDVEVACAIPRGDGQ